MLVTARVPFIAAFAVRIQLRLRAEPRSGDSALSGALFHSTSQLLFGRGEPWAVTSVEPYTGTRVGRWAH